jgi:peptide deformylase
LKPPRQVILETLTQINKSINKSQKRDGEVAQGIGPEFKTQYCQKKKKKRKEQAEHRDTCLSIPATQKSINRRTKVQADLSKSVRPYLENN